MRVRAGSRENLAGMAMWVCVCGDMQLTAMVGPAMKQKNCMNTGAYMLASCTGAMVEQRNARSV
jgi:hypothetical protein